MTTPTVPSAPRTSIPVSDTETLILDAVLAMLQSAASATRSPILGTLWDVAYGLRRGDPERAAERLLGLREELAVRAERDAIRARGAAAARAAREGREVR